MCPPAVSVESLAYVLPCFLFFALVFIVVVVVVAVLGFASCTACLFVFLPPSFYLSIFFTFGFFLAVSFPACFAQCSGDCSRESALEDVVV